MVFALDADHGQTLWATSQLAGATHLLGVTDGSLIAGGRQLWAVDARSGRVRFAWPESEHAGVRGFGRGFIAGREVFWPTRDRVYVFETTNGQPSRDPIDISPFTTVGANLIAAEDCLLVVARDRMMALGRRQKPTTRKQEANAVAATY
jgi:hypothetical protein